MNIVHGYVQTAAEWIEARAKGNFRVICEPALVKCNSPLTGSGPKLESLQTYITSAGTVANLPDACTIGDDGAVATSDGHLILSTVQRPHCAPVYHRAWYKAVDYDAESYFDGTLAVPTHNGSRNFAHVLADGIARIWLILQSRWEPDAWVVPEKAPVWLSSMLDMVGIDESRRMYVSSDSVIRARTLLVPSGTGFGWGTAPWAKTAVDAIFRINDIPREAPLKIWISRRDATLRRWAQEKNTLRSIEERGFVICALENLSLSDQLKLICNCNVIAGTHGAGLAWALAARCRDGLLYEAATRTIVHNSFRGIASIIGWSYARTQSSDVLLHEGNDVHHDIRLEPIEVLRSLDFALAHAQGTV